MHTQANQKPNPKLSSCDERARSDIQPDTKVLHLSQSQITTDARILRTVQWGESVGYETYCIGVIDRTVPVPATNVTGVHFDWRFRKTLFGRTLGALYLFVRISIKTLRVQPNIIHCHQYYLLPVATLTSILLRAALIYDAHELESETHGRSRSSRLIVRALERLCWPRISGFVTVSEEIREWYADRHKPRPAAVLYNIPDPTIRPEKTVRPDITRNDGTFQYEALYIGRVGKSRSISQLLELQSSVASEVRLSFLGWDPKNQQTGATQEFKSTVRYLGAVDHRDVVEIAARFDLGIIFLDHSGMSDYLALPNKLWEMLYAGIPILANESPPLVRLTEFFPNMLLVKEVPENHAEWRELVAMAASLGRRPIFDLPKQFTSDTMVQMLTNLYKESVERRHTE